MTTPRKKVPRKAEPVAASRAMCNVPGCEQPPEQASLCGTHFATHRGYAVIRTVGREENNV